MSTEGLKIGALQVMPYKALSSVAVELSLKALAAFRVDGIVAEKNGNNKFSFDFSGATVKFAKHNGEDWETKLVKGPLSEFLARKDVNRVICSYMNNDCAVCRKLPIFIPEKCWGGKNFIVLPIQFFKICNVDRTNEGGVEVDIQLSQSLYFQQSILNFQSVVVFDGKEIKPIENLKNSGIIDCNFKKAIHRHIKDNLSFFRGIASGRKANNNFEVIGKFNFLN